MPNGNQLSAEEFAAKVKEQYPAYKNIPDQELTAKILEKYPVYQSSVMSPGVAQSREGVKTTPQYTPERKYEIDVARGMGLDPEELARAERVKQLPPTRHFGVDDPRMSPVEKDILSQMFRGAVKAAPSVLRDPFTLVTGPAKAVEESVKELPTHPGRALGTAAMLVGGYGAAKSLPSAARAGRTFTKLERDIGSTPIAVTESSAAAQAAQTVGKAGGTAVKYVDDFVRESQAGTMTWGKARTFLSNITSKSKAQKFWEDMTSGVSGAQRHAIGDFVHKLADDIVEGARQSGKAEDYIAAMKEYRNAMLMKRVLQVSAVAVGAYAAKEMFGGSNYIKKLLGAMQ